MAKQPTSQGAFRYISTPWTSLSDRLLVHVGDVVLDDGKEETVTEIHWKPERDWLAVRVGYASGGALRFKDPKALVDVRRCITEEA